MSSKTSSENVQTEHESFGCRGRGVAGTKVFSSPVDVRVKLIKQGPPITKSEMISTTVTCPFIAGGHGQRCMASHPGQPKEGDGILCPYSFDYPYILKTDPKWHAPLEIRTAFRRLVQTPSVPPPADESSPD